MGLSTFDTFKNLPVREGMVELDQEELARLQQILLKIVQDIDEVCATEGIEYWLCGGSVLGAVRHKGMIPWDDDIDLYMTRDSFSRFERVFDKSLGGAYSLLTLDRDERFILPIPQVRMKGTYERLRDDFYLSDEDCGVCIDIFILDEAPQNILVQKLHGFGSQALGLITSCRKFAKHRSWFFALAGDDVNMRRTFAIKANIGLLFAWRSEQGWARTWDWWNGLRTRSKRGPSSLLVDPTGRTHYFGSVVSRAVFEPAKRLSFDGLRLPVPGNWDEYLKRHYGPDYMMPPEDAGKERHVFFGFRL